MVVEKDGEASRGHAPGRGYTARPFVPTCSVIVSTHNRPEVLRRCLDSLGTLDHPSYEVIVVDNTSGNPQTERVASEARARYLREPRSGLNRARNAGARVAQGELIAFTDDDAIADPAWLREHDARMSNTSLAVTTGRILPISTPSATSLSAQLFDLGDAPVEVDATTRSWFELANFGGLGFGANMVFRRSLFEAGFSFRESLGPGARLRAADELYAFFILIRDGNRVAYVPEAIVRHDRPAGAKAVRTQEIAGARHYGAYLTLLLVEEPAFRRRTAHYLAEALRRPARPWRRAEPGVRQVSRPRMLAAACSGPLIYLWSRCERGSRG
jgi:glycosyltransferase involved in cell wall biosynthesis